MQSERFGVQDGSSRNNGAPTLTNSEMSPGQVKEFCPLNNEARALARQAFDRLGMSMRAYDRILKVSRTIADLDGCEDIETRHLAEAIQYRNLDRELFR